MLTFAEREIVLKQISSSKIEQDTLEIKTAVNEVVQPVLTNPDFKPRAFTCAELACQCSSNAVFYRKTNEPLSLVLNWQDCRCADFLEPLAGIANSSEQNASYFLEGTENGAGATINWAIVQWNQPDLVVNLAPWREEVVSPPIFINTIGGLGSPYWCCEQNPFLLGTWLIDDKVVAIIESILLAEITTGLL